MPPFQREANQTKGEPRKERVSMKVETTDMVAEEHGWQMVLAGISVISESKEAWVASGMGKGARNEGDAVRKGGDGDRGVGSGEGAEDDGGGEG